MQKVLYIHHVSQLGGASTSLLNLITSFPKHRVEPLILCPPGSAQDAFQAAGIPVVSCPGVSTFSSSAGIPFRGKEWLKLLRSLWQLRTGSRIRKTIADFAPDVVHLNERSMHHAAYIAKSCGIPVVMHARNVANRESRLIHRLSIFLMKRHVDMTIAIDGSVAASLRELPQRTVIYNPARRKGVPENAQRREERQKVRVLFLSILLPVKGIWEFFEAARLLRHRNDIEFVIAGSNSRSADFLHSWKGRAAQALGFVSDIEKKLRRQIVAEELNETVSLLGFVTDVEELFSQCDINVFPSRLNGPSRGVFEAGMRGIPSIISLKDRVEDVVKDGVNALVVDENDPQALARAILELVDNPDLRERLGKRAQEQFSEQFDPDRTAAQVLKVYDTVIAGRSDKNRPSLTDS